MGIINFRHTSLWITFLLWEPYPSHHNGLFSPLLVLKDFAAKGQNNIGVIQTVRDFLPFLCNSIFLVQYNVLSNIRVCVFISDPFRVHNTSWMSFSIISIVAIDCSFDEVMFPSNWVLRSERTGF